jgi:hypothetical protein
MRRTIDRSQPLAPLECGSKRSATPLWMYRANPKRRRRYALPADYKEELGLTLAPNTTTFLPSLFAPSVSSNHKRNSVKEVVWYGNDTSNSPDSTGLGIGAQMAV